MINENTLGILQNIGFGADIDSLESYIVDFQFADRLTNMERYRYNYNKLYNLLKEVKPDSVVFTADEDRQELPFDTYDKLFEQYGNIRKCHVYNVLDNVVTSDVKEKILKSTESMADILALVNVQGLDIMCTYKDGYLCKVYLVSESKKVMDITYYVEDSLPTRIRDFTNHELVELRGKLTIPKEKTNILEYYLNTETAVAHSIRCKIQTQNLHIVFNDMISETFKFESQWDKMEFMQQLPIDIANYVLVRSIDCDVLPQALVDIDKTFHDVQSEIDWLFYGFEVRLNSYMDNTTGFVCILDDVDYRRTFEAVVKSVVTDKLSNKQILKVVSINCNKRFAIDSITLDDVFDLEKHNIAIGEKIQFRVVEKQPEII